MSLSLVEAMEMYPLTLAKLVAGAAGIQKKISFANIMEVPEVVNWMKGGEILFSSGYAFHGDTDLGCQIIKDLAARGVVAFAIKPGKHLEKIPQEMIDCAEKLQFPLLQLPENLPYMDYILPIFERVINKQLTLLKNIDNVHISLLKAMLDGKGMESLCSTISVLTKNPIFVLAIDGTIMSSSVLGNFSQSYFNSMTVLFKKLSEQGELEKFIPHRGNELRLTEQGKLLLYVPLYIEEAVCAYVVIDEYQKKIEETDRVTLEHAGMLVTLELLKEKAVWQKEQQISGELLEELLNNDKISEEMVKRRSEYLRFNLSLPFYIAVFDIDDFAEKVGAKELFKSEKQVQKVKREMQETIRRDVNSYFGEAILLNKSDKVIALISFSKIFIKEDIRKRIDFILKKLHKISPNLTFTVGIGKSYEGVKNVVKTYQEAILALNCGRRLEKLGNIVFVEDIGILRYFGDLKDVGVLKEYYTEVMQALMSNDTEGDLVKTLECYYNCKENVRLTAEKLYVHKNSVIYRLKKIEKILDIRLDDYEAGFNLQLCLKLKNFI
ncbi:MAG: PucR family transcriptional regulator ligand-binding domain-containing protein [Clostridia bacterium]